MTIVKITEGHTAITPSGKVYGKKIPIALRKKALLNGTALKLRTVKGVPRWSEVDMTDFIETTKEAMPTKKIHNVKSDKNITKVLDKAAHLKPDHLILDNLKWRYLMRSVIRGKNILMTGPSGCGKTLAAQSVAEALSNRPFFFFNVGATTDARSALIGNTHFSKERGTFVAEALFVTAIQTKNAIILLDELTRGHADAWNILMTVLDENQRYLRIDEMSHTPTIKVAEGVTFIATANIGTEYTATRVLDRALLDRFTSTVEMEPLNRIDEEHLLKMAFPDVDAALLENVADIAIHTRQQMRSEDPKVSTGISSRMTMEMAGLLNDGFTLAEAAEVCIYPFYSAAGGNDSERTYMKQLVQRYIFDKDTPTEDALYNFDSMTKV